MVTVRLPGQLRRYAAGVEFVEADGATVLEVLQAAAKTHPDLLIRLFDSGNRVHPHLAVFHDAQLVHHDDMDSSPVESGDRLDVLISVAGGAEPAALGFER
jgi:molybdopterin converting factor small subunit